MGGQLPDLIDELGVILHLFLRTDRRREGFGFIAYGRDVCQWEVDGHRGQIEPPGPLVQILSLMRYMGCSFLVEEEMPYCEEGDQQEREIIQQQYPVVTKVERRHLRLSFFRVGSEVPFLPDASPGNGVHFWRSKAAETNRRQEDEAAFLTLCDNRSENNLRPLGYAWLRLQRLTLKNDSLKLHSFIPEAVIREIEPLEKRHRQEADPNHRYVHSKAEYDLEVLRRRFSVSGSYFAQNDGAVSCCGDVAALVAVRNLCQARHNREQCGLPQWLNPVGLYGLRGDDDAQTSEGITHNQMMRPFQEAGINALSMVTEPFGAADEAAFADFPNARQVYFKAKDAADRAKTACRERSAAGQSIPPGLEEMRKRTAAAYDQADKGESECMAAFSRAARGKGEVITEWMYHAVESGLPVLLSFKGKDNWHSMTVVGHTFEAGLWSSRATAAYLEAPARGTLGSHVWVNGFIVMDGNFGPYRILSKQFLEDRLLKVLVPRFPWAHSWEREHSRPGRSVESGAPAPQADPVRNPAQEEVAKFLRGGGLNHQMRERVRVAQTVDGHPDAGEEIPVSYLDYLRVEKDSAERRFSLWFELLRSHIHKGQVVLRTVASRPEDYLEWLSGEPVKEGEPGLEAHQVELIRQALGTRPFWLVEISIPELFEWNNRRLGEAAVVENPDDFAHPKLRMLRLPGVLRCWSETRDAYTLQATSMEYHYPVWTSTQGATSEMLLCDYSQRRC